jgi:predicted dehydrogenase
VVEQGIAVAFQIWPRAGQCKSRKALRQGCATYSDFWELCARDDIDDIAVAVATPGHWHALCALEALRSGKDVYCEKPVTHLFAEGRAVYHEVTKRKAIFQTGSQQRNALMCASDSPPQWCSTVC